MAMEHGYLVFEKTKADLVHLSDGSTVFVDAGQGEAYLTRARAEAAAARGPEQVTGTPMTFEEWKATMPAHSSRGHLEAEWARLGGPPLKVETKEPEAPREHVSPRIGWRGHLVTATDTSSVTGMIEQWPLGGSPLAEIATTLDRLASEGWIALSVTEDKGLYQGTDAANESGPVRVRILLRREMPSVQHQ